MRKVLLALSLCGVAVLAQAGFLNGIRYYPPGSSVYGVGPAGGTITYYAPAGGASCGTLCDGLVSYWNLDEESGVRADAVGSNDLTDNNTVGFAAGKHNNAASFVAANSESLTVADPTNIFSIDPDLTLAVWANPSDLSGLKYLAGKTNNGAGLDEWQAYLNGANATLQIKLSGGGYLIPTAALTAGVWQLVIFEYDSSSMRAVVHVNDVGGTPSSPAASAPQKDQGADFGFAPFSSSLWNGQLDEPAIWSRVLTADERTELYNAGSGKFYNGSLFAYLSYQQPWRYAANDNTPDWLFQAMKRPPAGLRALKKAS